MRHSLSFYVVYFCAALSRTALAIAGTDGVTSFTPLGLYGGAANSSYASATSADGSVVVGWLAMNDTFEHQAFRWTAASGMALLPDLHFKQGASQAAGISADGQVIFGGSYVEPNGNDSVNWRAPNYSVSPILNNSVAAAASADGSIIAGTRYVTGGQLQPYRWTEAGGAVDIAPSGRHNVATGISFDGSVVVGNIDGGDFAKGYRWTSSTGAVFLESLPGEFDFSQARAISGDGSVVVGLSSSDHNPNGEAVMWDANGVHSLFDGPFESSSGTHWAAGVSYDGSVIVGRNDAGAFIWDADNGLRNLRSVLSSSGIDMTGWLLSEATGVSADGRIIVGIDWLPTGQTEGWIAVLPQGIPEPSTLLLLSSGALAVPTILRRREFQRS